MNFDRVLEVLKALEREQVRYVLIGGVALNLHGLARATQDIDLVLALDHENVERAKAALRSVFADPDIDDISAADLAGEHPVIRYVPPQEPFVIDLIARWGDAFRYEDLEAEEHLIEGVRVRVASPRTLYRMKKDTVRPTDRYDAQALSERFGFTEE